MEHVRLVRYGLALALVVAAGCGQLGTPHGASAPSWPRPTAKGSGEGIPADKVIRGTVTAVDTELGTLVIDVGRRQGVKPNTAFIVHRAGRYVGTIIADAPHDNLSSARYGRDMRTDVRVGDDVTAKLLSSG